METAGTSAASHQSRRLGDGGGKGGGGREGRFKAARIKCSIPARGGGGDGGVGVLTGRKRPPREGREVGKRGRKGRKGGRKGGSKTERFRKFGEFHHQDLLPDTLLP